MYCDDGHEKTGWNLQLDSWIRHGIREGNRKSRNGDSRRHSLSKASSTVLTLFRAQCSWYLTKRGDIHRIKEDLYYERYDRISTSQRLFISHSLSGITSKINSFNMLASFFLITFLWLRNEVKKKSSKSLLWYRFTTKSFIGTSSWYVYYLQALSMHVVFKSGNQIYRSILISKK